MKPVPEHRSVGSSALQRVLAKCKRGHPVAEAAPAGEPSRILGAVQRAMLNALDRDCRVRSEFIRRRWQRFD
jgi:hypothetical protein